MSEYKVRQWVYAPADFGGNLKKGTLGVITKIDHSVSFPYYVTWNDVDPEWGHPMKDFCHLEKEISATPPA